MPGSTINRSKGDYGAAIGAENAQRVLDWMLQHPGGTNRECAAAIGLSEMAVGRHVAKIRERWPFTIARTSEKPLLRCEHCGAPDSVLSANCAPPFVVQPHAFTGNHPADRRCNCPIETIARVRDQFGTCGMGGCPYGGDF